VTTPSPEEALERARKAIRGEILRWNPVTNLVSRQGTPRQLDHLLGQCLAGFQLVPPVLADLGRSLESLGYVDVGAGNGLPGLLWAAGIMGLGGRGPCWLVEPRKRRAWFLARVARQEAFPDLTVVVGRWGDLLPAPSPPGDLLVSLKALRLTEPEVLEGLESAFAADGVSAKSPRHVVITRFLGPDPTQDKRLVRDLQADDDRGGPVWRQTARRILAEPGVRLLVTAHERY
jgi:hypothetical protein